MGRTKERDAILAKLVAKMPQYPFEVEISMARRLDPREVSKGFESFMRMPRFSTRTNRWMFKTQAEADRFKKEFLS